MSDYVRVPVKQLRANPANVREDLGDLTELAASITAVGVLQPLVITVPTEGPAHVIDGHRRLAAARLARVDSVPCLVTSRSSREQTIVTMLAAAMHKQLEPLEQAAAFARLVDLGLTRDQVSARTGYSRATVSNRLLLLGLPDDAQRMLTDRSLTVAQATTLARETRDTGEGRVRTSPVPSWFNAAHPQYQAARARCAPGHEYRRMAGVCGQCWDHAIRAASERAA